jgi:hypothetical protein
MIGNPMFVLWLGRLPVMERLPGLIFLTCFNAMLYEEFICAAKLLSAYEFSSHLFLKGVNNSIAKPYQNSTIKL